jgi:putative component of toxin-antitoxin plasmid stabilization module
MTREGGDSAIHERRTDITRAPGYNIYQSSVQSLVHILLVGLKQCTQYRTNTLTDRIYQYISTES